MRLKLKYTLPIVQTLAAVALLVWSDRWQRALMHTSCMPDPPPSFTLLIAINAPLAIPRSLVFEHLPGWWDYITLVVAIAVFWYWVSLNIESWQQNRRLFLFSWMPLRLVGDTIAIGIGVMWALVLWRGSRYSLPPHLSFRDWLWFVPCACLPILWSAVLILLFGRDFVSCLLRSKAKPNSFTLTL
jgi:hypothetical protein